MTSMRRLSIVVLAALLAAPLITSAAGREPVRGLHGAVATSSAHATRVGVRVLEDGGNAVDAAVATAFALAVSWPTAGNVGGGGFLVYHGADGEATAFDFREKAPLAATETMYLDDAGNVRDNANHDGILSVGVPGTVAGLALAHRRLGSKPWAELVEPAIGLAEAGIPISFKLHEDFAKRKATWEKYPSSARVFLKDDGSLYLPGDIWRQPRLADTLARIRDDGLDGFYDGLTADLIADFMAGNGGLITREDLARYQAVEREPIRGTYRGYQIVSMPPPSSGGIALVEMLNILEGYDLDAIGHNSAMYLHLLTESMRRGYADRARYLGDPDFNEDMPVARLTSGEHAASLRGSISLTEASESDPESFGQRYESDDTTHISIVDADGNFVSLTYTLEYSYGSRIVVEGAGFLLNNEMGDFNAQPGVTDRDGTIGTEANRIRPQKRMLSSMTPTIVAKDGVPLYATGTPGGRTIINTVLQTILNVIDHGMNVGEALEAARIHHQWLPDETEMEGLGISADTRRLYEVFGHTITDVGGIGTAMAVYRDPETGVVSGAADSRAEDGAAIAY